MSFVSEDFFLYLNPKLLTLEIWLYIGSWSLFLKDECIFVEYKPWPGKNSKGEIKAIFSLKEIVGYEGKKRNVERKLPN